MRDAPLKDTLYDTLLEGVTDTEVAGTLGYREEPGAYTEAAGGLALERPIPDWRDVVSAAAYEFILKWETGGKAYFEGVIKGKPVWPGYTSGVTIGCGYDLGYHKPEEFTADWSARLPAAAMQRLSRGDGSTTLAFNMHTFRTFALTRRWRHSLTVGEQAQATRTERLLRQIGAGDLIIAVANAEPGADIRQPRTTASPTTGGWLINGRKTFGTGSPAADLLAVRVNPGAMPAHRIAVRVAFPYARAVHSGDPTDWSSPDRHQTVATRKAGEILWRRTLDDTHYSARLAWTCSRENLACRSDFVRSTTPFYSRTSAAPRPHPASQWASACSPTSMRSSRDTHLRIASRNCALAHATVGSATHDCALARRPRPSLAYPPLPPHPRNGPHTRPTRRRRRRHRDPAARRFAAERH